MKYSRTFTLYIVSFVILFFGCRNETKGGANLQTSIHRKIKARPVYPYISEFEAFVRESMEQSHIPGAAIAIVKDTNVLLLKGYGVKKFGTTDSVDIHSVFRVASVSKGFASMLAGILVQENLIHWDDKVVKYLPGFRLKTETSTRELSVRNILSHTSGLPVHTFTNMIEQGIPYPKLRDNLWTVDIAAPVGREFAYQNVVYSLIGDIVQVATHKSYGELLREKIFGPLNMTDASDSYHDIMSAKDIALPHIHRPGAVCLPIRITPEYYSVLPAAGVNASISDMSKWLIALLGYRPEVISDTTLAEIFKPEIVTPRIRKYEFFRWHHLQKAFYGFGWRILKYDDDTLIYHGGHVNGYRSEVGFCPTSKIGIVILTNSTGKLANDGVEKFFDAFFAYKNSKMVVQK